MSLISSPFRCGLPFDGLGLETALQPVLAQERVRYVGEPIALVLADDPYVAEDAAEAVVVDIKPLDAVVDMLRAPNQQSLWADSSNELCVLEKGYGDIAAAFDRAERVVSTEVAIGRHSGVPLETRGLVCDFDPGRDELTVWGATLVTHYHRQVLARLLGRSPATIHMRSTDAGGSFGVRGDFFPEDFLVAYAAVLTGCPVKWIEDRAEKPHDHQPRSRADPPLAGCFRFRRAPLGAPSGGVAQQGGVHPSHRGHRV